MNKEEKIYFLNPRWPDCNLCGVKSINMRFCIPCGDICWLCYKRQNHREHDKLKPAEETYTKKDFASMLMLALLIMGSGAAKLNLGVSNG